MSDKITLSDTSSEARPNAMVSLTFHGWKGPWRSAGGVGIRAEGLGRRSRLIGGRPPGRPPSVLLSNGRNCRDLARRPRFRYGIHEISESEILRQVGAELVRFAAEFLRLAGAQSWRFRRAQRGGFIHIHDVARVYHGEALSPPISSQ